MKGKLKCKHESLTSATQSLEPCVLLATRDGYCEAHHPDTAERELLDRAEMWEENGQDDRVPFLDNNDYPVLGC